MPRDHTPVKFGNMAGGINQFLGDEEAAPNQCADALDVIVTDGDVRRREAFRSVSAGPVFLHPASKMSVSNGTLLYAAGGGGTLSYNTTNPIYVGCTETFDGIDWGDVVTNTLGTPSSHKRLLVEYWNGSAWTTVPFVLDTTVYYRPGETYSETLGRNGQVHWHTSQLSGWALGTVAGVSRYWIRLTVVTIGTVTPVTPQQQWSLSVPGVRGFLRQALSSVIPINLCNRAVVMLGGDRSPRRGLEAGANLGIWEFGRKPTRNIDLTRRFGAGLWSTLTFPQAYGSSGGPSVTVAQGTSNSITDQCDLSTPQNQPERYSYLRDQPIGASIVQDIAIVIGAPTTNTMTTTDAETVAFQTNDFEAHLLRVTVGGGGGPAVGETRQIGTFSVSGGVATFVVGDVGTGSDGFSAAPVGVTRFEILRPPNYVYAVPSDRDYAIATESTDGRTLLLETARYCYRNPTVSLGSGQALHFELRQPLRFSIPSGDQWTAITDPLAGTATLANGSQLLEYDGRWLKELVADSDSPAALEVAGTLPTIGPDGFSQDQGFASGAKLRTAPPPGKWVVDFGGRTVVAGASANSIYWSHPHQFRRIWPWINAASVKDQLGQPLCGMHVLYDRLYAFTTSSIHEGTLTDDGGISFRPVSVGLGFSSHASVQAVPLGQTDILLGPSPDGLYAFAGGEPQALLDQWERVVPGGINISRLNKSVSCVLRQQGFYCLAVTPTGSASNTRIVVFDYNKKAFWLWSAPFGVASMSAFVDATGSEYILLGTEDGFLCTMVGADTDDGQTVTGRIRTRSAQPLPGKLANLRRICTTGRGMGSTQTVNYSLYLEESKQPFLTGAFPEDIGNASYGSGTYAASQYAQDAMLTHAVHLPTGTRGRQIQVELSSTTWGWRFRRLWVEIIALSSGRV